MLHAGVSELERAFRTPLAESLTPPSRHLLLFYAVECGLKAALLRRKKFRTTAQFDQGRNPRHDLMLLAKDLRLPATTIGKPVRFQLRRDNTSHEVKYAHQAWRYGVALRATDEDAVVSWLMQLFEWAKGELQG